MRHRKAWTRGLIGVLALCLAACAPAGPSVAPPTVAPPVSGPVTAPAVAAPSPTPLSVATVAPTRSQISVGTAAGTIMLVSNHRGAHVSFVHPQMGVIARAEVGESPWGIALGKGALAYVATARGVAVLETQARRRTAFVPFRAAVADGGSGEYRKGGMGIAITPDGKQVFVGVHGPGSADVLEVFDTETLTFTASVPVGVRPFQVLASRDGREVYSLDHDSFSVTIVERAGLKTRSVRTAPLGGGAFDKPHYAAQQADGRLLLPFQGKALLSLDPASGGSTTRALTANSHQHGIALSADGKTLLIVGTGAAGGATGGPLLSVFDLTSGSEKHFPLKRPHEQIALSPDGRTAFLTGGYLLGPWDGITVVNLTDGSTMEIGVPDMPLDIALLP